jgi:rhamnose transport system substrate-binding protein
MKTALEDPKYANLELLDVVYGNDQSEDSYNQALALVSKYPDMELIMAPTSIGIVAAAKAMQDEGLCDKVKTSGLGLPSELEEYTLNGCAPEFALWSFVDLGYLTYYTSYMLANGQIEAREGETFTAGRMGDYTIEKDPTRENGLRILMGPFTVYNKDNVSGGATQPLTNKAKEIKGGTAADMILLPKFVGNKVFDEAHDGAKEAHAELANGGELNFVGPTADNSVAGQIEIVTNAPTQGAKAIMISNNAGDQIAPAATAARDAGMTVVTWDSPIPSAEGEQVFVAQVDFDETGVVMADMALNILGEDGGKFAILSASPDAANQNAWIAAMKTALEDPKYANLELLDVVYGNDQSEDSYNQALALVSKYPDMELIMAPTSIGIVAAAKAMQDEGLCDKVKTSGLGLPSELAEYVENGCAPEFALWSFVDLGYLTYYTTYGIATGQIEAREGETFKAGRMGEYTITKDPTREDGLRILMGPFTVYTKDNMPE